jgi:hypothetical protein
VEVVGGHFDFEGALVDDFLEPVTEFVVDGESGPDDSFGDFGVEHRKVF